MRTAKLLGLVGFLALGAACDDAGEGDTPPAPDACVPTGPVTLAVTTPPSYACSVPFAAELVVTNGSCETVSLSEVTITGMVTAGMCGPPGPGTYTPTVTSLAAGQSATVLDLTTGPFCCGAPGCPAMLDCTELFTFTVATSTGPLTEMAEADVNLGGCSEVCM